MQEKNTFTMAQRVLKNNMKANFLFKKYVTIG